MSLCILTQNNQKLLSPSSRGLSQDKILEDHKEKVKNSGTIEMQLFFVVR